MMSERLLEVNNLEINYETDDGIVKALNGISISVKKGETLGIVGETGAGKTTLAKGIMGLTPTPPGVIKNGEIIYKERNLLDLSLKEMRKIRGKEISMIFQDPMTSLNPVMSVERQIAEVIAVHENLNKQDSINKAHEMLELVGIPAARGVDYPHQFSGGMKQRVIIAIALACNPSLLIADEPTTALDVTIQAQVIEMIKNLKEKFNMAMILITHDLGVVAQNCDRVAIIYAGRIIELGNLEHIFKDPKHPYTIGLFGSIPKLNEKIERLNPIKGLMPDPANLPSGCTFNPRCKYAKKICSEVIPSETEIIEGHIVRCLMYEGDIYGESDEDGIEYTD